MAAAHLEARLQMTDKEFSVPACAIFTFDADNKLAAETVYFDGTILLREFGVLA